MASLNVMRMLNSWKKRLALIAAIASLAMLAAACSGSAAEIQSAATQEDPADESPAPTTPPASDTELEPTEALEPEPTEPEPTEPEPTAAPEPEPTEVQDEVVNGFEDFALPDYVIEAVGDDYASYFVEVEPGINVHVLEVGTGYPVYLQHGAPTSGLLYRKVAEQLPTDQFRVIMPTMVGLGFSTKVPAEEHTLDNHMRWMNSALTQLDLDELIYVGHDWGGPVGMGALARSPELLQGAVLLNTSFGAPTEPVELSPALAQLMMPLAPEAELVVAAAIFDQLSGAQNDPETMRPEIVDLYRRPVTESDNPIGSLAILRMTATGPDHPTAEQLREIDTYLAEISDVPAEIVWGTNDPIAGRFLPRITERFPDAPVTETVAGHFLQEEVDSPEEIAAAIQRVREQIEGP